MEKSTRGEGLRVPTALIYGAVAVVLALLLILIYAICVHQMLLPRGRERAVCRGLLFLSSLTAAALGCRKQPRGKLPCALLTGGVLLASIILLSLSTEDGAVWNLTMLANVLSIGAGAITGCIISTRKRRRRKRA